MEYEDRYIAFIDILGFKSLLKEKTAEELYIIINNFQVQSFLAKQNNNKHEEAKKLDFQVTCFSDNVVISCLNKKEEKNSLSLMYFLEAIVNYQLILNLSKITIRAGITKGELVHQNDICYGPGLVRAYYLESEIAIFPKIVIDDNIAYDLNLANPTEKDIYLQFSQGENLFHFIDTFKTYNDWLNEVEEMSQSKKNETERNILGIKLQLKNLREVIVEGLKNENENTQLKYRWMQKQYNNCITPHLLKSNKLILGKGFIDIYNPIF